MQSDQMRSALLLAGAGVLAGLTIAGFLREPAVPPAPSTTVSAASAPLPTEAPELPSPAADTWAPAVESPAPASEPPPIEPDSFEDIVSRVVPAVVSIQAGPARGTGFFVRPDTVLTNAHVVEGQSSVQLESSGGIYTARVANVSAGADLAVLKVHNPNPQQPSLQLGSGANSRVGQEVIAVGSALGVLSNTVTRGIVSAVRQVGTVTLIQTDAAINPGNSGGPLVDRSGQVIGINSMTVASRVGQGLAFAVSIDHAFDVMSGRQSTASSTPLQALNQVMGGPGEGEQTRQRAEQDYARVVEAASRAGDQIDSAWQRYSPSCVTTAARTGGRPWFAVYEPNGVAMNKVSAIDCRRWLDDVTSRADQIRDALESATEAARRSGVYPGTMRDLRRRSRMDWQGWDR